MKGKRLSSAARELDVVVVAARYAADGTLALAQGYERRGQVWTDLLLLDRDALIQRLRSGKRAAVGEPASVPGDFRVRALLELSAVDGAVVLRAGITESVADDLGVPAF